MKPTHTYEEFAAKGATFSRNTLAGLEFRTEVLDKDLLLEPETGLAKIMPDEFFNVYDRTGPGYSSYKP